MSILKPINRQLTYGDIKGAEIEAKYYSYWKDYSIYVLPDNTVKIFVNDKQDGSHELSVTSELIEELSETIGCKFDSGINIVESVTNLINFLNEINGHKLLRTIHPVGQGALYSERFIDIDNTTFFLAVYDCGSISSRKLDFEISSYFDINDHIDLLFISHLDNDHVCGLKKLNKSVGSIKNVMLPLLDEDVKHIYLLTANSLLEQIITSPETFFKGSNIIYVRPVSDSDSDSESLDLSLNSTKVRIISSGTKVASPDIDGFTWCYIPYNYSESERIKAFYQELLKTSIEKPNLYDAEFIDEHRSQLKTIYSKVCLDSTNNSSLVVYSGGTTSKFSSSFIYKEKKYLRLSSEACIYLGDADLNQKVPNGEIMILNLNKRLNTYNIDNHIGILQLPHHGAQKNFHKDLLSFGTACKVYFASYGKNNQYGHPSTFVKGLVATRNEIFCDVTEQRDTTIIQVIQL